MAKQKAGAGWVALPMPPRSSAILAITLGLLPVAFLGAAYVLIQHDVELSRLELGRSTATFFAASAIVSLASRLALARVHYTAVMRVGGIAAAMALLLLPTVETGFGVTSVLGLAGIGNGLLQPASTVGMARTSSRARVGLEFGRQQTALPAATALAGLSVPALALRVGWQETAVTLGAVVALIVVVGDFGRARGDRAPVSAGAGGPGTLDGARMVGLAVGIAFASAAGAVLGTFVVDTLAQSGLGDGAAATMLAVGSGVAILVRLGLGRAFDGSTLVARHGLPVVLAASTASLVMFSLVESTFALVASVLVVFACVWGWPGVFQAGVVTRAANLPRAASLAHGGTFVGAFVGPLVFGAIIEARGHAAAWGVAAAWCAVATVLAVAVMAGFKRS